jgi:hypothetical protein
VPVHDSVAGMLELMATLEQRHSGGFFDYGGATMAW